MLCLRRRIEAPSLGFVLESSLGLTRRHRIVAAEVVGAAVFDPLHLPREPRVARTYFFLLLEGSIVLRRSGRFVHAGEIVCGASRAWFHDDERMLAPGPFRALAIQIDPKLAPRPARPIFRPAGPKLVRRASALHAALTARVVAADVLREAHLELFDALRTRGFAVPKSTTMDQLVPPEDVLLARSLSQALSVEGVVPHIFDIARDANATERTTRRHLRALAARYGLAYPSWQSLRRQWRVGVAALLMTLPQATPESVRRLVGLASIAGLCHAFARAGLPAPRAIQAAASLSRACHGCSPSPGRRRSAHPSR